MDFNVSMPTCIWLRFIQACGVEKRLMHKPSNLRNSCSNSSNLDDKKVFEIELDLLGTLFSLDFTRFSIAILFVSAMTNLQP